ncbi:Tic20 family protein [Pseudanabaena sp. 'Roaring Creek']|uniref:Tic20 family protein n=1 Tax=Pseudanabaena sp. 'Roaring Creek' TaxID=1681830 RepID=UPI0006D80EA6|nr:Tic20 family protein [Pseudanabaena sp. 'Roaring Creek']
MVRRSSVSYLDRLYASLTYLLPIAAVVIFGAFLFIQFPPLLIVFLPVIKLNQILSISIIDFISIRFVTWFCVFIFVVRSYKVNHFTRFNAMQALLLDIVVALVGAIAELLSVILGKVAFFPFVLQIIASVTFLGITAAFAYSVFQCIRGKYAEMPVISDVAYYQVR